jgi:hypothetical protein
MPSVEAVGWLVKDQYVRVAQQRRRDTQALAHAEGIALELAVGGSAEQHHLKDVVGPRRRNPGGIAQHAQVIAARAATVGARGLEDGADLPYRIVEVLVTLSADSGRAGGRLHQVEQHPQGCGLSGAVWAEETCDPSRFHRE